MNEENTGMNDEDLVSVINLEETGLDNSQLQEDRDRALDYYYGRPAGKLSPPSVPNRSQYISRDVADTVDWIMPSLMKTFLAGDEIVAFRPSTPNDVIPAKQETDYINYVVTEKNNAYTIFNQWFDDALIQKNGYVFPYWKEKNDIQEEKYEQLSQEELALLLSDNEVEIVSMASAEDGFDVVLRRVKNDSFVCIENIPPENVVVGRNVSAVSLSDASFCGFNLESSISDLRENGYDVPDDISDDFSNESISRNGEYVRDLYYQTKHQDENNGDPASRVVVVRHRWIRIDYDGDGVAELRYVMLVGDTILKNEKTDCVQLISIVPRIISHNHVGRSISDVVEDLQEINTNLYRGMIDNVVLANNTRYAVNQNIVDLDDMVSSTPGGIVRVMGDPHGAVAPLQHQMLGAPVMGALEMLNGVRETRTGVTKYTMGTDAPNLNDTATGIKVISNAANQRIEWIARTFAETGVKELFRTVHQLTLQHARKEEIIKLRGEWVAVDPRTWKKRTDMIVSVGLGAANREIQTQNIMNLAALQKQAVAAGIVTPENAYNTAIEYAKALGFKDYDRFFTHPAKMPKQPPKPDIEVLRLQAEKEKWDKDRMVKVAEIQGKQNLEKDKSDMDSFKFGVNLASSAVDGN